MAQCGGGSFIRSEHSPDDSDYRNRNSYADTMVRERGPNGIQTLVDPNRALDSLRLSKDGSWVSMPPGTAPPRTETEKQNAAVRVASEATVEYHLTGNSGFSYNDKRRETDSYKARLAKARP